VFLAAYNATLSNVAIPTGGDTTPVTIVRSPSPTYTDAKNVTR
jgi:hypothetical protein